MPPSHLLNPPTKRTTLRTGHPHNLYPLGACSMDASPHCLSLRRVLRPSRVLAAALFCASLASVLAQTANLNYTADYPSVERVKAEIKGSDPTDTIARQVGVLAYLSAEIKRIQYTRSVRG